MRANKLDLCRIYYHLLIMPRQFSDFISAFPIPLFCEIKPICKMKDNCSPCSPCVCNVSGVNEADPLLKWRNWPLRRLSITSISQYSRYFCHTCSLFPENITTLTLNPPIVLLSLNTVCQIRKLHSNFCLSKLFRSFGLKIQGTKPVKEESIVYLD